MAISRQVVQYGSAQMARRLSRSIPLLGTAVALFTLRAAVRRKGFARGLVDSALDATPFVGAGKMLYESIRVDVFADNRVRR